MKKFTVIYDNVLLRICFEKSATKNIHQNYKSYTGCATESQIKLSSVKKCINESKIGNISRNFNLKQLKTTNVY